MTKSERVAINYNDFQKTLKENNLSEVCQYLESLWDTYVSYMPISFNIANKMAEIIFQGEKEFFANMENEFIKQSNGDSLVVSYRPKISDFPQNICNVEGVEIDAEVMFRKSVYDFFHWARICIELSYQFINVASLGSDRIDIERLNEKNLKEKLKQKSECQNLLNMINEAIDNPEYKYIQAFDNCAKHIRLIHSEVRGIQITFGMKPPPKFTISAFSHKGHSYEELDTLEKIDRAESFVREFIYQLLLEIYNIIQGSKEMGY